MKKTKFRIWDGEKNYFLSALKSEANHYLQFGEDGFWLFDLDRKLITATEVGGSCQQYTGFTDIFCREIYNSDIFSVRHLYFFIFLGGQF